MKVLLILTAVIFISNVLTKRCKPSYHFWRPYDGSIPSDAFLAGTDEHGRKNYVAKIIPLDQYLWTIPAQWKEGYDHIDFEWSPSWYSSKQLVRVDKFIEILCTQNPEKLIWKKVNQFIDEVASDSCLVEGGIALLNDHTYISYIGKGIVNGMNYIGRVYLEREWPGVHVMNGTNFTKVYENFDVLSYKPQPIVVKNYTLQENVKEFDEMSGSGGNDLF